MRILYVTTIGMTMTFFKELTQDLLAEGHDVDIMCNEGTFPVPDCYREWGCAVYQHDCSRSPFALSNMKAILQIRKCVQRQGYDIVHCHTPVAALCTRLGPESEEQKYSIQPMVFIFLKVHL